MPVRPRIPTYNVGYKKADQAGFLDITKDIQELVERIEITEELEGQSDTLSLVLSNFDYRWFNAWTPAHGDRITVSIGYIGEPFTDPVTFEVDEPTYKFAPDTMSLKGQATPITQSLRQRNSRGYEGFTLADFARDVAERHGLELVGQVPEIQFDRVTQKNEMDLGWLKKLALRYGVIFKVESCTKLVFYVESELEAQPPAFTINRAFLPGSSSQLKKSAADTYKGAKVTYKDPKTQDLYEVEVETDNPEVATGDTLSITGERFENEGQAQLRAEEALRKANSGLVEGTLDLEGEVVYRAGNNFALPTDKTEFGTLGGKYQIRTVRHIVIPKRGTKMGWRSSLEVRKIF